MRTKSHRTTCLSCLGCTATWYGVCVPACALSLPSPFGTLPQMKVKKFYKRPDEALVQFRSPEQAVIGKTHLNGAVVFGRAIRVNFSKTFEVNLHTDASGESSALGQDFTGSPLHRYASGRHMKHVSPPTSTVHVANIPAATPVEDIRAVFEAQGTVQSLSGCRWSFVVRDDVFVLVCRSRVRRWFEGVATADRWRVHENGAHYVLKCRGGNHCTD